MKMKIILACTLLLFAIASVSAAENATSDSLEVTGDPLMGEGEIELVEDDDYEIKIPDKISSSRINTIEVSNMPWDASGNISISIDNDEKYNREVSVGKNSLLLNDLNLDYGISHEVLVNYSGDSKYMGFAKKGIMNPSLSIDVPEYASDGETITVNFNKDLTGSIKVLIDEKIVYNQPCSKGNVIINLDKYSPITHTYEVIYEKAATRVSERGYFTKSKFTFEANTMTPDEHEYGDNITFEIDLPKNVAGTAKFKGNTYTFKGEEYSYTTIDVSGFDIGDNVVEFESTYKGVKQKISKHITVIPKIILPTKLRVNESYELIFIGSDDCNGDLICTGVLNKTFKVKNGSAVIPIPKLDLGKHKLGLSYENYSKKYELNVLNETPTVEIDINYPEYIYSWFDPVEMWEYYPECDIWVTSNYDLPGTTTVIHDKVKKEYPGAITITEYPKYLENGNHTITVIYSGDSNIKAANKTVTYKVSDHLCKIQDEGIVLVTLPGCESGTITVNVDGKKYSTRKVKESYSDCTTYEIPLNTLKNNRKYNIEVVVNTKGTKFSKSKDITLTYPIEIYCDENYEFIELNDNVVEFILPKDIKSKATVKIDGNACTYSKVREYLDDSRYAWNFIPPDYNGYSVPIHNLKPGVHTVVVTYPGDDKYPSKSVNKTFNVTAHIEPPNYAYDLNSKINLKLILPGDAEGNLSAEIRYAGEDEYRLFKTVAVTNGKAVISLPSDKIGTYEFKSYYRGNYNVDDYSENIKINPKIVAPSKMNFGDDGKIEVFAKNASHIKAIVYISGEYSPKIPVCEINLNETDVINITDLNDKINEFYKINYKATGESAVYLNTIVYAKDIKFEKYAKTSVNFLNKIAGLSNINMYYGDAKYISLKIYDVYGKLVGNNEVVKITIGKYSFNVKTNKNGAVKFRIPANVVANTYKLTAKYKTSAKTVTLKVKQILSLSTVKVKKSAKKLVISAKMKNKKPMKGKIVTFKFAGKTIKAKTNKYGIAKVTIKSNVLKKLRVGKRITYSATYAKNTVKKTVRIGK